jgi:hypothetical protein
MTPLSDIGISASGMPENFRHTGRPAINRLASDRKLSLSRTGAAIKALAIKTSRPADASRSGNRLRCSNQFALALA